MNRIEHAQRCARLGGRKFRRATAVLAPLATVIVMLTGCQDDVQEEFRAAAGDSLQQGVSAILDGFVEGFFAVLEPESDTTTSGG